MTTPEQACGGVVVPMATPVTADGRLDLTAVDRIVNHLVEHGCVPFVLGTTGEATSYTLPQKRDVIHQAILSSAGRAPVYVGIASNCFEESVDLAQESFLKGADYVVAHLPFYYPLTPAQMIAYFDRLADRVGGRLLVYNIPATTGISIPEEVVYELSAHPGIVGVKDSERDLAKQERIIAFCKQTEGFCHFTGWGTQIGHSLLLGSDGLVPSSGNLVPAIYRAQYDAAKRADRAEVERLQTVGDQVSEVYQKGRLLSESLAALKIMMQELGLCSDHVLPPLTPLPDADRVAIRERMKELDVLRLSGVRRA